MGLVAVVMTAPIDVILPTFNGALYLREQVASIAQQTLRPARLLLRDDGSSDGTCKIICELAEEYGAWIEILPAQGNLGCAANVSCLLEATSAPYVALADQDDVWLPEKLEVAYREMCSVESRKGSECPVLVHSDLRIVGKNLEDLGAVFTQKQVINPLCVRPSEIALTNVVTGCTVFCNRSLLQLALPVPAAALVHDWWLALVASVFGEIHFHPSCLILYRQHGANSIGARGLGWRYWFQRLMQWMFRPAQGGHTREAIDQMDCFEQRYGVCVSPLPKLVRLSRWRRVVWLSKTPRSDWPHKHGVLRTLALYFWLLRI